MSNIKELLEGVEVEWKALGEVVKIKNGKDWKKLKEGNIPVYGSGGIMCFVDKPSYDKVSVLIPRKGTITNIFYTEEPFWNVDTIFYTEINESQIIPKYLYYFMSNYDLISLSNDSTRPSLTQTILNKIEIPIPPLHVQREIVRILDNFTELTAELTAELFARKKQYNYYRDQLLSFEEGEVEWKALMDIAIIGTGSRNTNETVLDGKYPFFVRSQEPRTIDEYEFDETAIITAGDGVGVGKVFHFMSGKYALHQRAYRIVVTDGDVMPKFLFHFIRNDFARYLETTSVHASVTSLRKPMFEKYLVPILPSDEQARIVAILDKFDALTNSITEGLPREIALRQQQYEYYRDMLLSFEREEK